MSEQPLEPLPGSLHAQWVRCGKNWCRCAEAGPLHGPYYYHFYREAGKQRKKYVPKGQVQQVRSAIELWGALYPPISSFRASLRNINQLYKTLTRRTDMTEENPEIEDVNQELAHYLEIEASMRARRKKAGKNEDVSRDESDSQPETEDTPLSDEDVRVAISDPPNVPARQRIKNHANVLKRTFPEISKLRTQDDWERAYVSIEDDYVSGQFLIETLGAQRYVEPRIAMTILMLRRRMIEDMQLKTISEFMLMDAALVAHYNSIKAQTMLGDIAIHVDRELFHDDPLDPKDGRNLDVSKFKFDEMLKQASGSLMTIIDSTNKTMIRSIKALGDLNKGTLLIRAEQVNIADKQLNQVVKGDRKRSSRRKLKNRSSGSKTDS